MLTISDSVRLLENQHARNVLSAGIIISQAKRRHSLCSICRWRLSGSNFAIDSFQEFFCLLSKCLIKPQHLRLCGLDGVPYLLDVFFEVLVEAELSHFHYHIGRLLKFILFVSTISDSISALNGSAVKFILLNKEDPCHKLGPPICYFLSHELTDCVGCLLLFVSLNCQLRYRVVSILLKAFWTFRQHIFGNIVVWYSTSCQFDHNRPNGNDCFNLTID